MFIKLAAGSAGSTGAAMSAGLGAMDAVFNPAAARAREELEHQNQQVIATPRPGDRLLREGRVVITLPTSPRP